MSVSPGNRVLPSAARRQRASTEGAAAECCQQLPRGREQTPKVSQPARRRCRSVRLGESGVASKEVVPQICNSCASDSRRRVIQHACEHTYEYTYEHECVCDVSAALDVYPFKLPLAW